MITKVFLKKNFDKTRWKKQAVLLDKCLFASKQVNLFGYNEAIKLKKGSNRKTLNTLIFQKIKRLHGFNTSTHRINNKFKKNLR